MTNVSVTKSAVISESCRSLEGVLIMMALAENHLTPCVSADPVPDLVPGS